MCGPKAPKPTSPATTIGLESILGNRPTSGPYSSTGLFSGDRQISASEISSAIANAFKNPKKPDMGALASILGAELRTVESPEVRALREQDQQQNYARRAIGDVYLSRFGINLPKLPTSGTNSGYEMLDETSAAAGADGDGYGPGVPELAQLGAGRARFGFPEIPDYIALEPDLFRGYFSRARPSSWEWRGSNHENKRQGLRMDAITKGIQ